MPYSLSVTPDGRILFISRPSRLSIYRPNARRINVITLPADIKDPWHAVETVVGTFIVCHGSNFNLSHRVCEVTITGFILLYKKINDFFLNRFDNSELFTR